MRQQLRFGLCLWFFGNFFSGPVQSQTAPPPTSPEREQLQAQIPVQAQVPVPFVTGLLRLRNVQVAPEGLLLIMNGNPRIEMQRVESPDRLIVDLMSTSVPRDMHGTSIPINQFGIRQIRVAQFQKSPSVARIVLDLDPNDPNSKLNWQTVFNPSRGGLIILPAGRQVTQPGGVPPAVPNSPVVINNSPVTNSGLTLIQSLSLTNSGQLLIQANRDIAYRGSLDLPSRTFNITISSAQISPQIQRPALPASSPIERLRLTQVGSSVLVGIKVAPGWQLREITDGNRAQIALQMSGASWGTVEQVPPVNSPVPSPSASPYPTPAYPRPRPYPSPSVNVPNRGRGVIVVDPGHGGPDPGTIGNGIQEKNVTLPISLRLGRILQQMGYSVVYTRTDDIDLDLEPRVSLAERVRAEVFVSIHANALETRSSDISGIETYHARGATVSRQLAAIVHEQIMAGTGALDRGVRGAGFYVIKHTSMPAILVETGFVTNPREAANLSNPAYQERMAASIARGVDQFIKSYRR
ncbi:N-acetylmuramoyl-L-alanine amidase [Pseudanabaena sp. PCC 6802]|uniref:N-acetylmuramoyl-L-alanine amidase n=1 Tax=Pseudanabaena sp. PCC 6802 TaxID=118173 RepID=UPI000348D7F9|nr:N-acetylmuramoyl-L-alanine amidase [Pseudanabaena sp. PCC 6802]